MGEEYVFNQTLDHFNPMDHRRFSQRYFLNFRYYRNISSNPIIVYIGGEAEFSPSSIQTGAVIEVAQQTHALIAGLEHRFFGKSQPFSKLNSTNLFYNTVDQALEDLASFITFLRRNFCYNESCNVLVVGGSYSGSLSSWFRLYYPHLANFSWSSSAPLNIKRNFPEYDAKIATVLRKYNESCFENTKLLLSSYHNIVASGNDDMIDDFLGKYNIPDQVDIVSALSMIVDVISYAVQYNKQMQLIEPYCMDASQNDTAITEKALQDLFSTVLKNLQMTAIDLDPFSYSSEDPEDPQAASRVWTWMQCNELGWLTTSAGFISPYVNLTYNARVCESLFDNMSIGNIESVERRYGLSAPRSTYVIFVHGTDDPWGTVGVQSIDPTNAQHLFYVQGGSHCTDLHAPDQSDSQSLKEVREKVINILVGWIKGKCKKECKQGKCIHDVCYCDQGWSGEFCTYQVVGAIDFWMISVTAMMVPLTILICIGGTAWWLFRRMHEEQFLLSLRY